jgi:hypothetical protein
MLRSFYRSMSIKNLFNARAPGQIATLLVLIMVVVLIFILVTVNIGNVSLQTIAVTNAADSAGLYLSSQLGTRAQQLYKALGYLEKCKHVSFLDTILSVVVAIVAIVITAGAASPFVFAAEQPLLAIGVGALGGAAGGALGGAIGGEDIGKSALGGAMVGMAVGGAFVAGGNIGNMLVNAEAGSSFGAGVNVGGTNVYTGETVAGIAEFSGQVAGEAVLVNTGNIIVPTMVNQLALSAVTPSLAAGLGIGAVSLGGGSSIYNAVEEARLVKKDFKDLAHMLNGLPDADRYREGAFLLAWSQTVNDPRVTSHNRVVDCDGDGIRDVGDTFDIDGDGDINEEIPCFQYWFYKRTEDLRINFDDLRLVVDTFFNTTLANFITYAEGLYYKNGALDRAAYNWAGDSGHSNGILVNWARTLEVLNSGLYPGNTNRNIVFWSPGAVVGVNEDCPTCTRAQLYHDDMDWAVKVLANEIRMARELQARMSIDELTDIWEDWIDLFDDGDDATLSDFRDRMAQISTLGDAPDFTSMGSWRNEIASVRLSLPNCILGPCPADPSYQICNPSCRLPVVGTTIPGSIDYDQQDEFTPARDAVNNIRSRLSQFRTALRQLRNDLNRVSNQRGNAAAYGGKNPATYSWTDGRGDHSITLTAQFVIPRVDQYDKNEKWYGSKDVCVGIVPQSHTPTFTITRRDRDINRGIGVLGTWNPFRGRIVRTCRARWRHSGGREIIDMTTVR